MLITQILYGYYGTQCLYTISQLGIAEHLQAGPKSITELAELTQTHPHKLYRMMRFMAAAGIFEQQDNKVFSLNSESKWLLSTTEGNFKDLIHLHGKYFYQSASQFLQSSQSDLSPFELEFGELAGTFLQNNHEVGQIYNQAMQANSKRLAKEIIAGYDFSAYQKIVDVGGGLGSLLVSILLKHTALQGINYDRPILQKKAEHYFEQQGLSKRCQYISGSFYDQVPKGGDLYLLKAIMHGKNDENALKILMQCKQAMQPKGKLLIIDRIISQGEHYLDGCLNDMNMLNVTTGHDRTLDEFTTLLNQAGFSLLKTYPIEDSLMMIEATKR